MRPPGTRFSANTSEASALAGYVDGMAATISTKRYMDSVVQYSYRKLSEQFGYAMDLAAALNPESYHHVYEWGSDYEDRHGNAGNPAKRLWFLTSVGSGGRRTVGYEFLPSVVSVPVNPQLLVPGKRSGKTVKEGIHIFTWKAPVFEYGIPVTIRPELSDWLAMPSQRGTAMFTQKTYTRTPGAYGTMGMFSAFFLKWWGGGPAESAFTKWVKPVVEKDTGNEVGLYDALKKRRATSAITFKLKDKSSFIGAREEAQRDYEKTRMRYIAGAAERRFDIYGD